MTLRIAHRSKRRLSEARGEPETRHAPQAYVAAKLADEPNSRAIVVMAIDLLMSQRDGI
jgi:hypothetical protein